MEPLMHSASVTSDGDAELSFEALTFGGGSNDRNHSSPELDDSPRGNRHKKKLNKKSSPHADDKDKGSAAVYISSVGDHKIDVQTLLKKLESFGVVKAYYFKEKQDFGFVQFLDPMVVDVVVETLNRNGLDGFPLSVERANGKSNSSALSFGGTPFSPSTPSLFSPSAQMLGTTPSSHPVSPVSEKPDTILVLKNLPFSLKQDQLQEILMQMNTNAPQSINLHFDNAGVFKGMAFIKYRSIEDAIKVFDALNGFDVGGRKVRVEYKRKNKGQQPDVPQEWIDEEDLKKLWDQIKDFSTSTNMSEISFAPTMSSTHKKHVHAMAEKLKLTHYSNGDQNSICIRKAAPSPVITPSVGTPTHSNGVNGHSHNGHSHNSLGVPTVNGMNRGHTHSVDIKSRGRTNSDTQRLAVSPANGGGASSFSDKDFRSPRGGSFTNKQNIGLSPADASSDWRGANATSPANTPTQGGVVIAPCRQPKGPDGSKGFGETYKSARAKPIQV